MHGDIEIIPNPFDGYSILLVQGSNIIIQGNGSIKGVKFM